MMKQNVRRHLQRMKEMLISSKPDPMTFHSDNEIDLPLSGISNANNMDNRYVDVSVDEGIRCASSYPEENAFIFSGRELNLMRRGSQPSHRQSTQKR